MYSHSFPYALAALAMLLLVVSVSGQNLVSCFGSGLRDPACVVDGGKPYCVEYQYTRYGCFACSPSAVIFGGGSCMCNANSTYCEPADTGIGQCKLYTILNKPCSDDSECKTTAGNLAADNLPAQSLYCVNSLCKPCSPTLWAANNNGAVNGVYTCPGFSASISNSAGTYKTLSRLSAVSFACAPDGSIVVINDQIDYNYQFPGGDRSNWTPSSTFAATNGAATTTAAVATSGSNAGSATVAAAGAGSTTAANGPAAATTKSTASATTGSTPVSSGTTTTTAAASQITTAATAVAGGQTNANAEDSGAVSLLMDRATVYIVATVLAIAALN